MGTDRDQPGSATPSAPAAEAAAVQFDKIELSTPDASRACALCQRPIVDEYFERAGRVTCPSCAEERLGRRGGGVFLRAAIYGGIAALVGTIVWYLIIKITDYELGLIAVGIGLMVGLAVNRGARGRGGWRYQALAMVLTYSSVTVSKVPFILKAIVEQGDKDKSGATAGKDNVTPDTANANSRPADKKPGGPGAVIVALLILLGIALASPFLAGAGGFMGIIIIGIALYEAWKINKRVPLNGPFRLGAVPAAMEAAAAPGGLPPPSR